MDSVALKAFKFFKKKFPKASGEDAAALIGVISTVNFLTGMCASASTAKDPWRKIEAMAGPGAANAIVLSHFFGIHPSTDFDPVQLRDGLGFDPKIRKLFGWKS